MSEQSGRSGKGLPFLVAGPSGGGKTTIVNSALEQLVQEKYQIERMVTYTTRPMRKNEENGVDYHFVTKDEFRELKAKDHFFEVTEYNTNFYGSPRSLIDRLNDGNSFIAITDRPGVVSYSNMCEKIVPIWITPPSVEELHIRLDSRAAKTSEDESVVQKRLRMASEEMAAEEDEPLCEHHVVNDELSRAINEFSNIIRQELDNYQSAK